MPGLILRGIWQELVSVSIVDSYGAIVIYISHSKITILSNLTWNQLTKVIKCIDKIA